MDKITPVTKTIKFLYFLAFAEGAFVVLAELIGAKLLTPFYGASLEIWTAVITVTIASLTLGYYIGGKLASNKKPYKLLSIVFSLAAFFIVIMPTWSSALLMKSNLSSLLSGSISSALFLIGPSVFCLGLTSPVIIQLIGEKSKEAGISSGNTYAISTLAGIISTLVLGYLVLPNWGTTYPLILASLALIVISFLISFSYLNVLVSVVFTILFFMPLVAEKEEDKYFKNQYTSEGLMGQLKVMDQSYPGNDIFFRLLFINGIPQTVIHNNQDANSYWEYVHRISIISSLKKEKQALLIGMGGGSIANELQKLNCKLDIVDIDKRMFEVAGSYFYFKPKPTTSFTTDDARHFIKTAKKKYDVIVIDVCSGEVQPSNLFTLEGIHELKKCLNKGAFVVIQYQEKIDPSKLSGSRSVMNTFMKNGFKVYSNIENIEIASVLILASPAEMNFSDLDTLKMTPNSLKQPWRNSFIKTPFERHKHPFPNGMILTDDRPYLEFLNKETIRLWREKMNEVYALKLLTH